MPRPVPSNGAGNRASHVKPSAYHDPTPPANCPGKVVVLVTGRGEQRMTAEEATALARDLFRALDAVYRECGDYRRDLERYRVVDA